MHLDTCENQQSERSKTTVLSNFGTGHQYENPFSQDKTTSHYKQEINTAVCKCARATKWAIY